MQRPWLKLYVGDWLQHPGLMLCPLAAQGLWMRMLCLMHQAEPYGHLRVVGKSLDASALARLVGVPLEEIVPLLEELEAAQLFVRSESGVIVSPRMLRDDAKMRKASEDGRRGGNPALVGSRKAQAKGGDKGQDKPQIPDTRDQRDSARKARNEAPGHKEAIRVWCEVFEERTGRPYLFSGSADGKQIQRLLAHADFDLEELRRRAVLMLKNPFWAKEGVDLKRFVSQWVALGNAGREVDPEGAPAQPSSDELAWCLQALEDPDPDVCEQARRSFDRWGIDPESARRRAQ